MKPKYKRLVFLLLLVAGYTWGQETDYEKNIAAITSSFLENNIQKADSLLQKTLQTAQQAGEFDKLSKLVYWSGKIELESSDGVTLAKTEKLVNLIVKNAREPHSNYLCHLDVSRLYNETGQLEKAMEQCSIALKLGKTQENKNAIATAYYFLGEYSLRSGNMDDFFEFIERGHQLLLDNPEEEFKIAARVLNYMGAIKYFTAQPDSAYYFYNRALKKVGQLENNLENRLYFPAAINANMVLLKQSQNEFEEALRLAERCILLNKKFLSASKKHPLRFRAQRNLSLALRNLASLYEQLGDYERSHQIAQIAYEHAQKEFQPKLLEYFSAVTLLAETNILKQNFKEAIEIMQNAKHSLTLMDGDTPLLWANYYTILGSAFYGLHNYKEAKKAYVLGNQFHSKAQKTSFSSDRLFAIMNLAMCYAKLDMGSEAYALLDDAIDHQATNSNSERVLQSLLISKARIASLLGDYEGTLQTTSLVLAKDTDAHPMGITNSSRATILMLNAKARYHLKKEVTIAFLKALNATLNEAIKILETRMGRIDNKENINALIEENRDVFDFSKKINLELFRSTKNDIYLSKILELHESSIYHRIRNRLHLKQHISFSQLPKKVSRRELLLREKIEKSSTDLGEFLEATAEWDHFLDSIATFYPKYYRMRYASLLQSLEKFQEDIPKETSIVRYFTIENQLYVYANNGNTQHLFELENPDGKLIHIFEDFAHSEEKIGKASNELYRILWKPFAHLIDTENVIVYPNGALFNLNFELLSPSPIKTFRDFGTTSLLAKYNISYNYSLLLLNNEDKLLEFEKNFIAFAPEFDDKMKTDYKGAINDSIHFDKAYLTLLPQPFSSATAQKYGRHFDGEYFLNQNASKEIFSKNAGEHKIIHIGTHATSDNANPELSRLVFAKNISDSLNINDNYLYAYEIYNQDLSSSLAILTACETGKPGYQSGEGMISLAHAFNYAGSESILTSLWQIDEQSSNQLLDYFYQHLQAGSAKDVALKRAKLDYIANAEGRTAHPQYWAGLILMGDTSAIELPSQTHWWLWILLLVAGLLVLFFLVKNNRPLRLFQFRQNRS